METVLSWVGAVLIVLWVLSTVYFAAVHAYSRWRCRGKDKPCHDRGCRYSRYCEDYVHRYSAEEIAELRRIADNMKG